MCSSFECVIKIKGHTFDIAINDSKSNFLTFSQIFPKISEICKIAANEVIEMKRHSFEVINGTKKYVVKHIDEIIRNNSIICITQNTTFVDSQSPIIPIKLPPIMPTNPMTSQPIPQTTQLKPIVNKNTSNQTVVKQTLNLSKASSKALRNLLKNKQSVELFHKIVISIKHFWVSKDKKKCNWKKVVGHILSLMNTNKSKADINYNAITDTFYRWASYYAKNYDSFDGLLEPSYQQIFDLLKVVHILDLNLIYNNSNSTAKNIRRIFDLNRHKPDIKKYSDQYLRNSLPQKTKQVIKHSNQMEGTTNFEPINWSDPLTQTNNDLVPHNQRTTSLSSEDSFCSTKVQTELTQNMSSYNRVKEIVFKSMDKSSKKSLDIIKNNSIPHKYIPFKSVPTNRTPSTVEIILPPKKTISLSEYRKMKENPSNSVNKSEENSPNVKREVLINDKKETIDKQNSDGAILSDPRLKRRLESKNEISNESQSIIESIPEKKIKKSEIIQTITIN